MKIPNNYVVVPNESVIIPRKEYDFLRDDWSRLRFTVETVKDWIYSEYLIESRKGYVKPEMAETNIQKLAILLDLDLSGIEFKKKEDPQNDNL